MALIEMKYSSSRDYGLSERPSTGLTRLFRPKLSYLRTFYMVFGNKYSNLNLKENFKRDALIDAEDGGYIRYMSSCSDEITILLPSPVVSDASTSMSDSERSFSVKGTRQMLILNDFFSSFVF